MTQLESGGVQRPWRVFLSSASGEFLKGYRKAAAEVVGEFPDLELVQMEDWGARDAPAREYCVNEVLGCDLLIGIFGDRYGSHPPDDSRSFTEIEFDTACRWELGRLLYVLDERPADEHTREEDAAAQRRLRERVLVDRVAVVQIASRKALADQLRDDLRNWIDYDSIPRSLVGRREEYARLRQRLMDAHEHCPPVTIVYGIPGVGKSKLIDAVLSSRVIHGKFGRTASEAIGSWDGLSGPGYRFSQCCVALGASMTQIDFERESTPLALDTMWTQLVGHLQVSEKRAVLSLIFQPELGRRLDPDDDEMHDLVPHLARVKQPAVTMLLETSDPEFAEALRDTLELDKDGVFHVTDLATAADGLRLMSRFAPVIENCTEEALDLAKSLGNHPFSLRAAARQVQKSVGRRPSEDAVRAALRDRRAAVEGGQSFEERHRLLLTTYLERLSEPALELLRRLTVVQTKPSWFDTGVAAVLSLPLAAEDAQPSQEPDAAELESARRQLNELEYQGMLELAVRELPDGGTVYPLDMGSDPIDPWTIHPSVVAAVQHAAPISESALQALHARAEAFYRKQVSNIQGGSYAAWYRMERPRWRHDVHEWLYHLGRLEPVSMVEAIALVFLDVWWWWDCYIEFEASEHLVQAGVALGGRSDMPDGAREALATLGEVRKSYPRQHAVAMVSLRHRAGVAEDLDAAGKEALRQLLADHPVAQLQATRLLRTRVDELGAGQPAQALGLAPSDRDRFSGLLNVMEAHALRRVALSCTLDGDRETGLEHLKLAAACYRNALQAFERAEDAWDCAWAGYELAEVLWRVGQREAADALWRQSVEAATDEADRELLANLERAKGDECWVRARFDEALKHYGRALCYALAFQLYPSKQADGQPWTGTPDDYTQQFYEELRLQCALPLLESVRGPQVDHSRFEDRLTAFFEPWAGAWPKSEIEPSEGLASMTVDELADEFFPPGPTERDLHRDDTSFHRETRELLEVVSRQPWVLGIG